ncbi:DUF4376 domain-containing protein [Azospirillum soli]|uniref:DUF4376 domain-containing protein n=1 Tax=Azospirillum soli TaxID=1304799 RepID=UPI001AE2DD56|nr:DUF4376 domain-containing protein [Azospirillum soli]MBP2314888.1 hypothetical protein [Azospirillum soli]
MSKWARVQNGRLAEFSTNNPAGGRFPAEVQWVELTSDMIAFADYAYELRSDGSVAPPSIAYLLGQLFERVGELRWRKEIAGAPLPGGGACPSDDRTKTLVNGAYRLAEKAPTLVRRWKTGPGEFQDFDAATIMAMGDAIAGHVQACIDREYEICSALRMAAAAHPTTAAADVEAVLSVFHAEVKRGFLPVPQAMAS